MKNEAPKNLIDYLKEKWKNNCCPMCGESNWFVQTKVFQLTEFSKEKNLFIGGPVFPVIPVMCVYCGNTILVSAIQASVIDEKKRIELVKKKGSEKAGVIDEKRHITLVEEKGGEKADVIEEETSIDLSGKKGGENEQT